MFSFCNRKLHFLSTFLLPIRNPNLRFNSNATEQACITVDYLIDRCGLSPESALKASQKINIKSTTKADSVLTLLDSFGFSKSCISKIISKEPKVLFVDPKKTLEPRLEIFSKLGFSVPDVGKIFWKDPTIIGCANLENKIVTSMEFLKTFLHDDKNVILAFTRLRWIKGIQSIMDPNIKILLNQGVTKSGIAKLILHRPQLLTWRTSQLSELVLQAKEMGFDPSSLMFIIAISTLSHMNKTTLEVKREVFRSFRWSDDEILCLFRKQPVCLKSSEKKLRMHLDFFMNKVGLTAEEILKNPVVLLLSMEKRIIPRYSVLLAILSQGLMRKQSISTALTLNEDKFLERFVKKYHQELPHLLKEYNVSLNDLGDGIGDQPNLF